MEKKRDNIVPFPSVAKGPIIPFLALAEKVGKMRDTVTIISTPLNIKNLRNSVPSDF